MPSLLRLFPREADVSTPYSAAFSQTDTPTGGMTMEPWRVVTRIAAESKEGLTRSLQWLCLFSRSGIEIPLATFKQFSSLGIEYDISLPISLLLARSIMSSTWLKSKGRQEVQVLLSELHTRLCPQIISTLKDGCPTEDM